MNYVKKPLCEFVGLNFAIIVTIKNISNRCNNEFQIVTRNKIFEYINYDTFSIKIWETEEDRDAKEFIVLDGTYYDLKDAVARLKKVMSRQNYAFAEIENEYGELFYSTDGVNEEYHKEQNLAI